MKNGKILQGILWLVLLMHTTLTAQTGLKFRQLNKKSGLSHSTVFSITQDREGFIWLGTRDGLNRYDGFRFKVYRKTGRQSASLPSNDIRVLYFDEHADCLWIGTFAGLSRYRSSDDGFRNYHVGPRPGEATPVYSVSCILRDSRHRLWVGTQHGLYLMGADHRLSSVFNDTIPAAKQAVNALKEDQNGRLFVGTDAGLFRLQMEGDSSYALQNPFSDRDHRSPASKSIKSLAEDRAGNLWIGTAEDGLYCWDRSRRAVIAYRRRKENPASLNDDRIRTVVLAPDGTLWVSTFSGLNKFTPGQNGFQRFNEERQSGASLSNSSIRSLFFDRSGGMWIGTYHRGVNYFDAVLDQFTNFEFTSDHNSLSHNIISSFAEDPVGNIWIGTEGGGVDYYDRQNKRFSNYRHRPADEHSLSGNTIKTLLADGPNLWIGTYRAGLNLLDIRSGRFQRFKHNPDDPKSLAGNNVYALMKDGDHLWTLCHSDGLSILDLNSWDFQNYRSEADRPHSLSSDFPRAIVKDREGRIWIGTEAGLNLVVRDGPKGPPASFRRFLPDLNIYALFEDSKQRLWLGSFGSGLIRFEPESGRTQHYGAAEGLSGNTVLGILEDDRGQLWLSTSSGITRFDPQKETFVNYDDTNGLINHEHNYNAYAQLLSGELLFGGTEGFSLFHPEDLQVKTDAPNVVFTDLMYHNAPVKVNDHTGLLSRSINQTQQLVFRHNEASFTLQFSVPDYMNVNSNQYAFLLEGLDKHWNYRTGKSEASYTIQKHGDYVFRLKGANSSGVWSNTDRVLSIKVLPPPWLTAWAYCGYALVLGLLVLAGVRYVRLNHRLQLEQMAKEQQKEMHEMKLNFFTNITHELRTPLALITGPIEELLHREHNPEKTEFLRGVKRNANRLLNLANQLLVFRKVEQGHLSLKVGKVDLIGFLEEIFSSFEHIARRRNITYDFEYIQSPVELWLDPDKIEKVVFNLLSNAFKFTPEGGRITLSIQDDQHHVFIQVQDSGRGIAVNQQEQVFKRFYEKAQGAYSMLNGVGIGLALSKQLIELHHGTISLQSRPGEGARFTITLSKGNRHFQAHQIDTEAKQQIDERVTAVTTTVTKVPRPEENSMPVAGRPCLLVVEDNPEMQHFVQGIFASDYKVVLASDGKQGFQMAMEVQPDLVISDVVMPVCSGTEFCKRIKSSLETSHIPVILLTAKHAIVDKLEGLRFGADDYIAKPFSPEELKLRVRNLLRSKEEIKNKFLRVVNLEAREITITSADEDFLNRAIAIAHEQIENTDFSVDRFAYLLAVSRPVLFTKIKALTGQTPNNFMKTLRLKQAARLLSQQKLNVSEIAYKVGFRTPKYFRICFHKQFGQTPTQYARTQAEDASGKLLP